MATVTAWFTLGLLAMTAGTLVLLYGARLVPESQRRRFALLVAIPGIAIFAYAIMALGYGGITAQGRTVFVPRYVDWLATTPINVLFLGLLAGLSRGRIRRLVVLQAATIAFGFLGAIAPAPWSYLGFMVGCVAFAGVVWILYDGTATASETLSESGLGVYKTLRNFVIVLWLIYPVVWLLAPAGIGLMDVETSTLVVAYLDVVTKVGFGLIALHGLAVVIGSESVEEHSTGPNATADADHREVATESTSAEISE